MARQTVSIRKLKSRDTYKFNGLASLNPRTKSLNPQPIGEEIEKVRNQEGGNFKPAALVAAAHIPNQTETVTITVPKWDKSSPLYGVFETDPAVAAQQHNVQEARHLVNSVVIVKETESGAEEIPIAVSIYDEAKGEQRYENGVHVLTDTELQTRFLLGLQHEIDVMIKQLDEYKELAVKLSPSLQQARTIVEDLRGNIIATEQQPSA